MSNGSGTGEPELWQWIRQHRVTYETAPHLGARRPEELAVGSDLRLHARALHGRPRVSLLSRNLR